MNLNIKGGAYEATVEAKRWDARGASLSVTVKKAPSEKPPKNVDLEVSVTKADGSLLYEGLYRFSDYISGGQEDEKGEIIVSYSEMIFFIPQEAAK